MPRRRAAQMFIDSPSYKYFAPPARNQSAISNQKSAIFMVPAIDSAISDPIEFRGVQPESIR